MEVLLSPIAIVRQKRAKTFPFVMGFHVFFRRLLRFYLTSIPISFEDNIIDDFVSFFIMRCISRRASNFTELQLFIWIMEKTKETQLAIGAF